jgi:hypothetical protein
MADLETITGFTELFRGGRIARDTPGDPAGFRPWANPGAEGYREATGATFRAAVKDHLGDRSAPIGVYPLMEFHRPSEGLQTALRTWGVYWGCIDWDVGENDSLIHARNVQETLRQLTVASWIERSRSKGYHLWVFYTEPVPARAVREGLIGACKIVDAPITEVNPKQIELTGKGWGNGVRLPYPKGAAEGRNTVVTFPPLVPAGDLTVAEFVDRAVRSRVTPEEWQPVHDLYQPPPPPPPRRTYATRDSGHLAGLAGAIRRNGPRVTPDKPHGDRSSTLFSLACAMVKQGYPKGDIEMELVEADHDWGGKFEKRPDGRERLCKMVADAERVAAG